jgi:hypothetical protein
MDLQEQLSIMKEKIESEQNKHINELLEKDDKIIKLSRELRDYERKMQDIH